MKKVNKDRFILIEEADKEIGLTFKSEGFNSAEVIGILTVMLKYQTDRMMNTKTKVNNKKIW